MKQTKLEHNALEIIDAIANHQIDLSNSTIFLSGEIDMSFTINLRMKIAMMKAYAIQSNTQLKEINIVGNSIGGDASVILSILDLYEELKTQGILVNVHFEGNCMSAATFICAGATGKRVASKRCRFMIHEIQVVPPGGTFTQAKSFSQETAFLQKEMYKEYARLTGYRNTTKNPTAKEIKIWQELCTKESYISADKAKELGLVDEIA